MTVIPFDERSSSRSSLVAWPDAPGGHLPGDDKKQQAVAELLEHGVLSHAFGRHGEYKVRTTMTTRQTWQYRCCVLRHGKAIKGAFFPIIVEHQPSIAAWHYTTTWHRGHSAQLCPGSGGCTLHPLCRAPGISHAVCALRPAADPVQRMVHPVGPPDRHRGDGGLWILGACFPDRQRTTARKSIPRACRPTPDQTAEGCSSPRFQSHNRPQLCERTGQSCRLN